MNVMTRIASIRLIEQMKAQPEYAKMLGQIDTSRYVGESEDKNNDLNLLRSHIENDGCSDKSKSCFLGDIISELSDIYFCRR